MPQYEPCNDTEKSNCKVYWKRALTKNTIVDYRPYGIYQCIIRETVCMADVAIPLRRKPPS
jgi:hypothetical protein